MAGLYYAFGGISGGKIYKRLLLQLFMMTGKGAPQVLYIGAATNNQMYEKKAFRQGCEDVAPGCRVDALDLAPDMMPESKAGSLAAAFARADVIYFDGGRIDTLRDVFARFNLKDHCRAAHARGALVGGICGGGSLLAAHTIFKEDERISSEPGIGLIGNTAISCYMDMPEEYPTRLSLLMREAARPGVTHALGIADNQLVVFENDAPRFVESAWGASSPFTVKPDGVIAPLPAR